MNKFIKYNIWNVFFIMSSCIILSYFYLKGVAYFPDSKAYIDNYITDLPLYPLVIDIFSLFGMKTVVLFQVLLALFSIYYFIFVLSTKYNLTNLFKFIIFLILMFPLIKMGNYILTDVIGYALSIFFLTFFIKNILENKFFKIIYFLLFLLVLLRPQFKILYVFLGSYILITFIFYDKNLKKMIISIFSLLAIYFTSNFLVTTYNQYYNGVNSYIKFEGTNYITTQLYIANKDDFKFIKEDDLRIILKKVLIKIDEDRLSSKYFDSRCHFASVMVQLKNIFRNEFNKEILIAKYGYLDDISKKIAFELLRHNVDKYLKYILRKPYDTTGLSVLFIFILFFVSLYGMFKSKDVIFKLVFYISLFSLMNNFLIYAVARFQMRYLIYSDFILLSIMVLFFYVLIEKYNKIQGCKNESAN